MNKVSVATVWLDGCSGCHMSFLDIDERIIALAEKIDLVYSPLVDTKDFPDHVDVTIVEGAVSNLDDFNKVRKIRQHTGVLIALGDCAVTGNVPSIRNFFTVEELNQRAYHENATVQQQTPTEVIPPLLDQVRPVHEVVKVDLHIPGCPPSADTIYYALTELLSGNIPELSIKTRFGA